MGPLLREEESCEYLAGRFAQDVATANIRASKAQVLTRLMPWTGLGFLIISTTFTPLFSRKLGQPCTQPFPGLRVRETSLLIWGVGGEVCSVGMEPIDGIGILFSGWRQQSMLEKVRIRAVSSVPSEPPEEGDG